jgi:hypothetical protein
MHESLEYYEVLLKPIRLIKITLKYTATKVKINNDISEYLQLIQQLEKQTIYQQFFAVIDKITKLDVVKVNKYVHKQINY